MKKSRWFLLPVAALLSAALVFAVNRFFPAQPLLSASMLDMIPEEPVAEELPHTLDSVKLLAVTGAYAEIREARTPVVESTSSGGGYVWTGGTSVDFTSLRAWNSDIVAYIYSPGTPINYPVAWTGSDYYLHTNLDHQHSEWGAIYIAKENATDFSNGNTILYGHHMKDRSMFASIDSYKQGNSYYNAHPVMYVYTPSRNYQVNVFAGFPCPADDEVFATGFSADQIQRFIGRSTFSSGITPTHNIITLCTCSYEHDNWRYVLLGDLVPM